MKKLGKLSLKEMKDELIVVENNDQRKLVGGSGFSTFEVACLYNYATDGGNMTLSQERFNEVSSYANSVGYQSSNWVEVGGTMYEARQISFYGNSDYDLALGTATVFYDSCGNAVGFKDTYDFNAMPSGARTEANEVMTQWGSMIPGGSYGIYYGIHN